MFGNGEYRVTWFRWFYFTSKLMPLIILFLAPLPCEHYLVAPASRDLVPQRFIKTMARPPMQRLWRGLRVEMPLFTVCRPSPMIPGRMWKVCFPLRVSQ